MVPLDCATVALWIDEDPSIKKGLQIPEEMDAMAVELALLSTVARPQVFWSVVERDGEIIAALGASHLNPPHAVVHQVVSPHHRFGRTAFSAAKAGIEYARSELGVTDFLAYVPRWADEDKTTPHPAIRLNRALGFVPQDIEVLLLRTASEQESDDGS